MSKINKVCFVNHSGMSIVSINEYILTFNIQRSYHIVVEKLKVLVTDPVLDISLPSGEEVVDDRDLVTFEH